MGAEYQEQVTILIDSEDREYVSEVCKRENVTVDYVGNVENTGNIKVVDKNGSIAVDLNLDSVLENIPQKVYEFNTVPIDTRPLVIPDLTLKEHIIKIFGNISASSKDF